MKNFIVPAIHLPLCLLLIVLPSCKSYNKNKSFAHVSNSSIARGEKLAIQYCQTCHMLPEPEWLDANTWAEGVMPVMGPYLGIFRHNYMRYPSAKGEPYLDTAYYPSSPALSGQEWQDIINYYTALAPDSLPPQQRKNPILKDLDLFTEVKLPISYPNPGIAFIQVNASDSVHRLLAADMVTNKLYAFNSSLQISDSVSTGYTLVSVVYEANRMITCDVGMLNPNDGAFGSARSIQLTGTKWRSDTSALFSNLQRPVHFALADLNADKRNDFVVSEFGYHTGKLSLMTADGKGSFSRQILRAYPGAISTVVNDYNNDGRQDIWALLSQAEEGIFLYTNRGNGKFEERQVLRFPSVYGSSSFELVDFNKDGHQDIIYTCGDNADYSIILKPYHGVYIFLNDGSNNFSQKYFYPINGCYKALARDFDNDGDLDIATIAFFADYEKQPEEGFVYLQQDSTLRFSAHTLEHGMRGRWLTMDAGDIDGDGLIDLALGNFAIRPSATKSAYKWNEGPVLLVLKNMGKKAGN